MYLLLKKQTSKLPNHMDILNNLWGHFLNMGIQEDNDIPMIRRELGFTFTDSINDCITNSEKSILMLLDPDDEKPCAVLIFCYHEGSGLYINYLDGDKQKSGKQKSGPCGGGATYLLNIFCKSVDAITPPYKTIKIELFDATENRKIYDNYFSEAEHIDFGTRYRNSHARGTPRGTTLRRLESNPLSKTEEVSTIKRGNYQIENLRKYTIMPRNPTASGRSSHEDIPPNRGRSSHEDIHPNRRDRSRDREPMSVVTTHEDDTNMTRLIDEFNILLTESGMRELNKFINMNKDLRQFLIEHKDNKSRFTGDADDVIFSLSSMQIHRRGGYVKQKTKKNKCRSKMKMKSKRYIKRR